jgi:peptide/nickel transport system substrate-binding protein
MSTTHRTIWRLLLGTGLAVLLVGSVLVGAVAAKPAGQMTWALHFTTAPTYFDPAETPGIITPFLFLYALHDALAGPADGPEPGRILA